tara:strand:+ start:422 stop:805 length:384 start_codon:yes stop_codon:yes gene_type:complete
MSGRQTARLEQMLLIAILDNSETLHREAQDFATDQNFTQQQINVAVRKVTSFLRWHGVKKLLPHEHNALLKLQSIVRMFLARKRLRKEMNYWERLAKLDSMDHMKEAEKIYKVLNRPKKKRKICAFI